MLLTFLYALLHDGRPFYLAQHVTPDLLGKEGRDSRVKTFINKTFVEENIQCDPVILLFSVFGI